MKTVLFISLLLCFTVAAATLPANSKALQYTGRLDFTNESAPVISWPGTSIALNFTSSSIKIILEDQKGKNCFNAFIDGDFTKPIVIKCMQGKHSYEIASGLAEGRHKLLLTKRTEGGQGSTIFHGLELPSGGKVHAPDKRPDLKIEFIGDSITVGLGSEAKNKKQEHNKDFINNFITYGAITARNLKAEYVCISKSGIGLVKSWFPTIMPQYYDRLDATSVEGNGTKWDFSKWQPDIVVINLFQNDSWIIKKNDPESHTNAYEAFIKTIRGHYPKARIICALGSMSASKSKWAAYVQNAAKNSNDPLVHSYIFKTNSGNSHPKANHHQAMAKELTDFIQSIHK